MNPENTPIEEKEAETTEAAETMEDYAKELEASFKKVGEGDVLAGTVIGVSDTEVILDLKYYAEGIIQLEDLSNDPDFSIKEDIKIGDVISASVKKVDDGNGNILLSKKEANDVLAWDSLKILMEEERNIKVKISEIVNAGVVAYVEGIRGFIPASKLSLSYEEDLQPWLSKEIEVRVIDMEQEKNKLILSAKEILREREKEEKKNKISNVRPGLVTEGTVESIQPYGAFISLGDGLSGLVHISQISEKRIKHPGAVLNIGDKVNVKVIGIKEDKISLSMKALHDVASEAIEEETFDLPESEGISTNLGSLLRGLKL